MRRRKKERLRAKQSKNAAAAAPAGAAEPAAIDPAAVTPSASAAPAGSPADTPAGTSAVDAEVNPYQAGADALMAAMMEGIGRLEARGFKLEEPPPGWQPPRQRKPTEGFYRRQIADVRSGVLPLPPEADRNAVADVMAEELDCDVDAETMRQNFLAVAEIIQGEIDARAAKVMPSLLAVYHEAKATVGGDPNHPLAAWVREMDHALDEGQGRAERKGARKQRKRRR